MARSFWSTFLLTSLAILSLGYLLLERTGDYLIEQLDSQLASEAKGAIFILSIPNLRFQVIKQFQDNFLILMDLEFL